MLSKEENEAIIDFEREVEDGRILESDILLSLDTGIIILDLIKKQQKEINFYKKEELGYITGYEDGKRHKQTAVMIKKGKCTARTIRKRNKRLV